MLFSEGRAMVGGRIAKNTIDFALALGSLGVDRGLQSFIRYAFLKRYGDSFFEIPLDIFQVSNNLRLQSILEVKAWTDRFRNAANQKQTR